MSLPDTAEYWEDVKRNYPYSGPEYFHIPGFDCGHKHYHEAKFVDDVNCTPCKKAIHDGYSHELISAEEHQKRIKISNDAKHKHRIEMALKLYPNNPICECGFPRIRKTNHHSKKIFWGCFNFPICKNAKPINNG